MHAANVFFVIENAGRSAGGETVVVSAQRCSTVREILERTRGVQLIFTSVSLPDGNWSTVVREVVKRSRSVEVIVCSQELTTSLRREALLRGARCMKGAAEDVLRRVLRLRRSGIGSRVKLF